MLGVQQTLGSRSRCHRCSREAWCVREPTPASLVLPTATPHPEPGAAPPGCGPTACQRHLLPAQAVVVSGGSLAERRHLAPESGRAMGLPRSSSSGVILGHTVPELPPCLGSPVQPAGAESSWV